MRLQQLQDRWGVSVRSVALKIKESPATVDRWFNGETEPRVSQAIKLADFFAVTLDDLVGRTPPPPGSVTLADFPAEVEPPEQRRLK